MNFDNDSYQINVTKNPNKPREDNHRKNNSNNDSFLLPLFLAIVVGIWKSPDLIDIRDYIPLDEALSSPRDKYNNPYELDFNTQPFTR